ncbi:Protein PEP-related development arrested 1, chloroplastic [Vitis vinifera]|uniref:Protein PEP-related development arrested 1, chloroplastic n=1 Tax=Vitis vinifera TaxID=29760 RepID=A0A438DFV6_VITVI|nr:Protein PEP-related development arrested 1, chloroplastic [Vitis vinifera]
METRPVVPDRKLLARLVLIREEARNMMGGGILDERNDRGLNTLPESEVNFLTKLVALKPGETVQEMIKNVMQGKDEGADNSEGDKGDSSSGKFSGGIAGRSSVTGRKPLPVRPGMFLETVSKIIVLHGVSGIYGGNISGITAQHLEWEFSHQTYWATISPIGKLQPSPNPPLIFHPGAYRVVKQAANGGFVDYTAFFGFGT